MKIVGSGSCLPSQALSAAQCDDRFGLSAGTVQQLTGVTTRYYITADESQVTMGTIAARQALDKAGLQPGDIDLVIGAAAVPYQPIPATAPRYMNALGIPDGTAFAFDVNSTCLGFVTALEVADGLLRAGRYKRALIISSEVASRALPWEQRPDVAGLFGDGAAAAIIERGPHPVTTRFATFSAAYDACQIGAGGTRFDFQADASDFAAHSRFDMDGKALFRITSQHFAGFVNRLLADAGWHRDEVALVVPHQASPLALSHLIRQCHFAADRVVDVTRDFGNQIAASIPFALDHAKARLRGGDKVLLLGTSAGVSFGGAALVW